MSGSERSRRVRSQVIVVAIALVAVAALLVLSRFWLDRPVEATDIADADVAASPEPPEPAQSPANEPRADAVSPEAAEPVAVADPAVVEPAGPLRIIVLPARFLDPEAEAVVQSLRRGILGAIRAMPNVEVVDVGAAELPANAGPLARDRLSYLAVSRRYESPHVVEISEQAIADRPSWYFMTRMQRASGAIGSGGIGIPKNGNYGPDEDPHSIGVGLGKWIVERVSRANEQPVTAAANGDQRDIILDTSLPEEERVQALSQLDDNGYDSEIIAAAVDLATRAESAESRALALGRIRQSVYEPTLAQPLSNMLVTDPDPMVRREAALALGAYARDPSILPYLDYAENQDSSAEVRVAARMATMNYDQQQAFKRESLLDTSLTPADRLAPTAIGGGTTGILTEQEEIRAYAEIVTATDDPEVKRRGLQELERTRPPIGGRRSLDPEIIDIVVDSFGVEDDGVRRAALNLLRREADNPDVRAVLETALEEEPELAAQARIAEALAEAEE